MAEDKDIEIERLKWVEEATNALQTLRSIIKHADSILDDTQEDLSKYVKVSGWDRFDNEAIEKLFDDLCNSRDPIYDAYHNLLDALATIHSWIEIERGDYFKSLPAN